jgi:micrococcal nuclease
MNRWVFLSLLMLAACGTDDKFETVVVDRVLDGDTVELLDGRKVRYIGVNTPELKNNACYAKEARDFNEALVLGKEVELEFDERLEDDYGRTLAYVWLNAGGTRRMVNMELLKKGYGTLLIIPPDDLYEEEMKQAELDAKASGAGLWTQCE